MSGVALSWLTDFVVGRVQRVVIDGVSSDPVEVVSGVPQGSVLGPLLFLVSVWDLPIAVGNLASVRLYADDSRLWRVIRTVDDRKALQGALDSLCSWASSSALVEFSEEKCVSLSLFSSPPTVPYVLKMTSREVSLRSAVSENDLGVRIDARLDFVDHVRECVLGAKRKLGVLWRCFRYLDSASFLMLYKSIVRPQLEFCSPVWGSLSAALSDSVESVQRRATWLVPELRHLSYPARLRQLGLPTLAYRRFRADLLAARGLLQSTDPVGSRVLLRRPQNVTRGHSLMLEKRRLKTKIGRRFFSSRVQQHWNALPQECISAPSINDFKSALNRHFVDFPLKFDWKHGRQRRI